MVRRKGKDESGVGFADVFDVSWKLLVAAFLIIVLLVWLGACEKSDFFPKDDDNDSDDGDGSSDDDWDGSDWNDNENYQLACASIDLPSFGDLGGFCEDGACEDGFVCDNYRDWAAQVHRCGCVESSWCPVYCFEYVYTTGCDCPPGSSAFWTSRSTFYCVPDGYECLDGEVVESDTVEERCFLGVCV